MQFNAGEVETKPVSLNSTDPRGIHAAKERGMVGKTIDFFRTKKVSGVIAVGAESVTVVKKFKEEEFKIGLEDYIDDED
jgi:hypothetical protein